MSEGYKRKLVSIYGNKSFTDDYRPSVFDVLYPTPFKRNQLAKHLNVEEALIQEVYEKVNLDYEEYKTIEQLQTNIQQIKEGQGQI
jgi:hypothetical protein